MSDGFDKFMNMKDEIIKARDSFARSQAIEFGKFLKHLDNGTIHYNPETKEETDSIGFSPYDVFIDENMSIEELFSHFIEWQKRKVKES